MELLHERMKDDASIFFVCAVFSSPKLDFSRQDYTYRFISIGIAESKTS